MKECIPKSFELGPVIENNGDGVVHPGVVPLSGDPRAALRLKHLKDVWLNVATQKFFWKIRREWKEREITDELPSAVRHLWHCYDERTPVGRWLREPKNPHIPTDGILNTRPKWLDVYHATTPDHKTRQVSRIFTLGPFATLELRDGSKAAGDSVRLFVGSQRFITAGGRDIANQPWGNREITDLMSDHQKSLFPGFLGRAPTAQPDNPAQAPSAVAPSAPKAPPPVPVVGPPVTVKFPSGQLLDLAQTIFDPVTDRFVFGNQDVTTLIPEKFKSAFRVESAAKTEQKKEAAKLSPFLWAAAGLAALALLKKN